MPDRSPNAIVVTLYVYLEDSIKVFFSSGFNVPDVRNSCIVNENMHGTALSEFIEQLLYIGLLRNIGDVSAGVAPGSGDFILHCRRVALIEVENANRGTRRCELKRDRLSDTAAAAGDDSGFAVEPELS